MCSIKTYTSRGPFHLLCVPGLVPDGPETFLRQLSIFRRFGSVSIVTYPHDRFDLDWVINRLIYELHSLVSSGRRVVLVGVSVGGGICIELLRRLRESDANINLSAFILISPFTCTQDLAPLLARLYGGIVQESDRGEHGRPEQAVERGRTFFRALASRASKTKSPTSTYSLWTLLNVLTPYGFIEMEEERIRSRIERTITNITPQGGLDRVMALREFRGLDPVADKRRPLTTAPTLILWGSKERHTLTMEGPGTGILCRPDLAIRCFPDVEVHWLYEKNGEEVPHASLLKHYRSFNQPLRLFLRRCAKPHGWLPRFAHMTRAAMTFPPLLALRG